MPLSHVKIYQLENNVKVELIPSLSTILSANIASQEMLIDTNGF
jgi:hypothetical protein